MSESECTYVCSRGFLKRCDIIPSNPISSVKDIAGYDFTKIRTGSVVYIHGSAIPAFIRDIFPTITNNIILVSGDCDESVPSDIFKSNDDFISFIEDPRIIHWFSQNGTSQHPKFTIIPIGMCYHAIVQGGRWIQHGVSPIDYENTLKDIAASAPKNKILKCYSNFQFQMYARLQDRMMALRELNRSCVFYEPARIDTYNTWQSQVAYHFVVSPFGHGYDCHRTWEALALGLIPIVKTSPIDRVFEGLPVVIVQRWSDITPAFLEAQLEVVERRRAAGEYDMRRLTLDYWMGQIEAASTAPLMTQ